MTNLKPSTRRKLRNLIKRLRAADIDSEGTPLRILDLLGEAADALDAITTEEKNQ